ncbi:uncharacterized protein SOCE26_028690 [Sorangium cellulosum]|uniref:Secreted protein n=1 Tax=Sorangium cellulosum TaxID=56 RepID=A0A2L0EQ76_SORCE|nr:hypothetical protein [Sorangium cellulosum]AUX41457.1 uncharacterized protein SOCE26_028690 [Sorangium cellulosum]
MRSRDVGLLGLGAFCAMALSINAGGCQAEGGSNPPAGPTGTTGAGAGTAGTSSGEGGGGGLPETTGTGTGGGGAGGGGAAPRVVTIQEVTMGTVTDGIVEVKGAVAMSPKFLVSKSSAGRCTYGVYLSAPGLTETEAYSGILAVDRGNDATTGTDDELYCAKLGEEPAGGEIPDDVMPGDVLDITGETSYFLLNFCGADECGDLDCNDQERACYADEAMCADREHRCWEDCGDDPLPYVESKTPQRQLAYLSKMTKVGEAPVPKPHLLSSQEAASLSASADGSFHDRWGGVKVRVSNVTAVPWSQGNVVNFGNILADLDQDAGSATLQVGNNVYYHGYAPAEDACHKGPTFSDVTTTWEHIDGFSTLDGCIWTLQAVDPCADFSPASELCGTRTNCYE